MAVNPLIGMGGLGAAAQAAVQKAIADQGGQEAFNAKQKAEAKARADAAAKARAQVKANAAAASAKRAAFVPEIPADFWELSDTSRNWTNPYYDPTDPRVTNPDKYTRFDYTKPGSGIANSGNLAASFDQAFLAGLGLVNPVDLSGYGQMANLLPSAGQGGFSGAFADYWISENPLTPEIQKALKLNSGYDKASTLYRDFTGDDWYQDAFRQVGIDPNSIKTREDLDAIDPNTKASVFDYVQRAKQAQNQLPPSGILDSVAGKLALGLTGLISPIGAAGLGAFAGGLSGEGGIGGALSGALTGYGYGSILNNGIQNPFTGTEITPPVVYNGAGSIPPIGNGPAWVLDHAGDAPNIPTTGIDIPNPFDWIPPVPDFGGGQNDNPQIPPINTGGQTTGSPPIDDSQPDDTTIPPIVQPPVNQPPVTNNPSTPSLSDPTNYDITQGGLLNMAGRYLSPGTPGPPQALRYFDYDANPFMRII